MEGIFRILYLSLVVREKEMDALNMFLCEHLFCILSPGKSKAMIWSYKEREKMKYVPSLLKYILRDQGTFKWKKKNLIFPFQFRNLLQDMKIKSVKGKKINYASSID